MESKKWVDFRLVKEAISMEMLLLHYGISDFQRNGDEAKGNCPFHQSESGKSLAINFSKNTFYCFAKNCKAKGNVLDFVAKKEKCTVKDAALRLDGWFNVTGTETPGSVATTTLPPNLPIHLENTGNLPSAKDLIAQIESHLNALKLVISR